MSLPRITVHILMLVSSVCIMHIYGKPMSNKENENEVVVHGKSGNDYGTRKNVPEDSLAKKEVYYSATRRLHKHSKTFPAFEVIKCVVEEMSKRGGHLRSLESDNLQDNICKLRYRRHHHTRQHIDGITTNGSRATNQGSNAKHTEGIRQYDIRTIPRWEDNCTSIAAFLSNSSNLRFVRRKANDLACVDADLSGLFHTFDKLAHDGLIGRGHRVKIVRKWKHFGCRLYRRFLECTRRALPVADVATSPNERKNDSSPPNQTNTSSSSVKTVEKEAVHTSDSSHIDFLNFMIGYNLEDNNDYQMWFY